MLRSLTAGLITAALTVLAIAVDRPLGATGIGVVATIKPVHSLVAGVMRGVGEPALLVKGGGSPHSYSLRPSDAKALQDARVVFWVGEGLETFLVKPLEALSGNAIVVRLSEAEGAHVLAAREGGTWERHGHGEQEGHELEADHPEPASEAHGRDRSDMHLWLDPHNAEAMVGAIVAALSDADPDNTATYRDNGGELREQLDQLDQSLSGRLAPVADRPFVMFHDAYRYLEDRYGLNAVGTISVDPGRRPGARRLSEIQRKLSELDAACVFAEPQFEPALVNTVIEGTSAKKGVLDPLGADLEAGPDQYFVMMNTLADSLVDCLGTANSSG